MATSNNKSIIICLVTDMWTRHLELFHTPVLYLCIYVVPELAHGDDMSKASSLVCLLLDIQHRYSTPLLEKKLLVPANGWSLNGPCFFFSFQGYRGIGKG